MVPEAKLERSVRLPWMLVRLPLRLVRLVEKTLRPVKKEVPSVVTLPLRRSSVKIAKEQPMFWKALLTLFTVRNP